jgi:DNA-binding GntR family transcriptional regulator
MQTFDVSVSELTAGASSVATDLIREAIVTGRLKPGDRLPEERLAQELRISRTPIREALRQLQTEGLVEVPRNRGARVRVHTEAELDDVYQLRALLEGFAARRAADRVSAAQITEMRESCERYERLDVKAEHDALLEENDRFHRIIFEAAGSELLTGILRQVTVIPRAAYRAFVGFTETERRASVEDHRRLTSALEQHDGERAELIARGHILEARDMVLPQVRHKRATPATVAPQ